MQALVQGAWSASMAMLEGKKPSQSPEEIARQTTQQWLDECASVAKAEHAKASPAGVALAPVEARITTLRAMRLQVKEEEAALEQEVLAEQAKGEEAALKQKKIAEQATQASRKQESDMAAGVASSSATGSAHQSWERVLICVRKLPNCRL